MTVRSQARARSVHGVLSAGVMTGPDEGLEINGNVVIAEHRVRVEGVRRDGSLRVIVVICVGAGCYGVHGRREKESVIGTGSLRGMVAIPSMGKAPR